ncbi:MAG TPA: hypothetical protein VKA10_02345 [Prolixibacteraceae bacterium]|nr:hypothetical protein [Prolixibacteraceae bacterium]
MKPKQFFAGILMLLLLFPAATKPQNNNQNPEKPNIITIIIAQVNADRTIFRKNRIIQPEE